MVALETEIDDSLAATVVDGAIDPDAAIVHGRAKAREPLRLIADANADAVRLFRPKRHVGQHAHGRRTFST